MNRITTSQPLHGPYQQLDPDGPWWVQSVLYTTDLSIAGLCAKHGCTITDVASAPADYLAAVAAMKAEALERGILPASTSQDDEMPTRYSYFTGRPA